MLNTEWRKSSRSGPWTDNCVEVRTDGGGAIYVRDTKDRDGGTLTFTSAEWTAFIDGAKAGEFDI